MMGVLNLTPDSFSDGGQYNHPQSFVERARELLRAGAKVLDLGAQSTAPRSRPVSAGEERERLTPFIRPVLALAKEFPFVVSLDTYRFETANFFFSELKDRGFHGPILWNSVAGVLDAAIGDFLGRFSSAEYVYTHNLAPTREAAARHLDYTDESRTGVEWLAENWGKAVSYFGERQLLDRIWWDPGFGFAKTFEQNEQLLHFFADGERFYGQFPVRPTKLVLGIGRKSFLRRRWSLGHTESLSEQELFAGAEVLHAEWLQRWHGALMNAEKKVQVLIRLHDPGVFAGVKKAVAAVQK